MQHPLHPRSTRPLGAAIAGTGGRTLRPPEKRTGDRLMGVAVVDEDRLADPSREVELSGEDVALDIWRREIAEEVEPDLADGSDPRITGQRLESCPDPLIGLASVMRMEPHCGRDQLRETLTQLRRRLGAGEVPAGDQDADNSSFSSSIDDRLAVVVKRRMLQVAVRVDEAR